MKEQHIDNSPFLDLLDKPEQWNLLCAVFDKTIFDSFGMIDTAIQGKVISKPPMSEIKRRFKICEKWFRIMRGDLGFSVQRSLDMLPKALATELLGLSFDPTKEADRGWFPQAYDLEHAVKI